MAEQNRSVLKEYFRTGKKPTEQNYTDIIDSFVNKSDDDFVEIIPPLPDATTTQKGIVEQATLAEVEAGTDDTRFLTPKGAKRAIETFTPEVPVQSVNGQTGLVTIALNKASWLDFSGRFHLFTDNRWVGTNPNFGQSSENYNTSRGTGATPSIKWNSLGIGFLPEGTTLHSLEFIGRANNSEVNGIEIQLSCQGNNLDEGVGYNNTATALNSEILSPTSLVSNASAFTKMQRQVISLGDFVLDRDRIIEFCCRPSGTLTTKRYWSIQARLHFTLT